MKKLVNSTATADVGYVEKLPYRPPPADVEAEVVDRVGRIIRALQDDLEADIRGLRDEVDELVFDLFEIRTARDEVRRFYETAGRAGVEDAGQAAME